jgi:hypothetical protein
MRGVYFMPITGTETPSLRELRQYNASLKHDGPCGMATTSDIALKCPSYVGMSMRQKISNDLYILKTTCTQCSGCNRTELNIL